MDRSLRSLPDPVSRAPNGERRRNIRQKLHTPVYASFNGPQAGMVVDLSELLDLNEQGFAVQTSQRLEVNQAVTVCLDLPETKNYIHCSGQVVWSDDQGRGGVRFSALPDRSRQLLKEWLFANLMIGCVNHSARIAQLARRGEGTSSEPAPVPKAPIVPISEGSPTLAAVEAVGLFVREMGGDLDKILQVVTDRALSLTAATGAALALQSGGKMICRARAGEPAPPLGTPVDVTQGLSGECVRHGHIVTCEDAENDARVDPEVCRALGIRALMAAPIVRNLEVAGLLEIFSPHPRRFTRTHEMILERLIELIPLAGREEASGAGAVGVSPLPSVSAEKDIPRSAVEPAIPATQQASSAPIRDGHEPAPPQAPARLASEDVSEPVLEPAPAAPPRLLYRALIGLAIIVVFGAIGYVVLAPRIDKRWAISSQASQRSMNSRNGSAQNADDQNPQASLLTTLRKLAEQGNPDAQWQMGARYHNGEGLPQDDVQAMQWFHRAAEQGHVTAQSTLGAYYWAGRGVPKDLFQAYFWSALALAQGDENSKARLEGLASQMTREQVAAASEQADLWLRTHASSARSATN